MIIHDVYNVLELTTITKYVSQQKKNNVDKFCSDRYLLKRTIHIAITTKYTFIEREDPGAPRIPKWEKQNTVIQLK